MPIREGIHHVHLISENPDATADWYVRALGAEITAAVERRGARNVSLRLGGASLYVRGIRESDEIAAPEKSRPLGIHHIGFIVDDLDAMLERIEAEGGELAQPVFTGDTGNRVAFVLGPDSAMIELIEPPKE